MAGVLGSIGELVAAAKAAPGKMNYGSAGPGSTFHMSAELFKAVAYVNIRSGWHAQTGDRQTQCSNAQCAGATSHQGAYGEERIQAYPFHCS